MDYNVKPDIKDIVMIEGDTLKMSWDVYCDIGLGWVLFPLTGMTIKAQIRNRNGALVIELTSTGGSPQLTYVGARLSAYCQSTSGMVSGSYKMDFQVLDGADIMTVRKSNFIIQKQITV